MYCFYDDALSLWLSKYTVYIKSIDLFIWEPIFFKWNSLPSVFLPCFEELFLMRGSLQFRKALFEFLEGTGTSLVICFVPFPYNKGNELLWESGLCSEKQFLFELKGRV